MCCPEEVFFATEGSRFSKRCFGAKDAPHIVPMSFLSMTYKKWVAAEIVICSFAISGWGGELQRAGFHLAKFQGLNNFHCPPRSQGRYLWLCRNPLLARRVWGLWLILRAEHLRSAWQKVRLPARLPPDHGDQRQCLASA